MSNRVTGPLSPRGGSARSGSVRSADSRVGESSAAARARHRAPRGRRRRLPPRLPRLEPAAAGVDRADRTGAAGGVRLRERGGGARVVLRGDGRVVDNRGVDGATAVGPGGSRAGAVEIRSDG